ncbi:MAG: hypothetical protein A2V93_05295 [Ignavibacteria bacterium RBG_16_34_14]|nr:MAG: hypothetical protein A2V93_05295 [Ignavibacteria bacterium RBG_16_34_14]
MQNTTDFKTVASIFRTKEIVLGQVSKSNTAFSYAANKSELGRYKRLSGNSIYIGREGIEFYPQELFLLEIDEQMPKHKDTVYVRNFQNRKSKYKIPQETFPLEKKYLHPLVKGINIERFHIGQSEYLVPFPYDKSNTRSPIPIKVLNRKAKLLAKYLNRFKSVILQQTNYNEKIIGKKHSKEFYALARVGEYSFAKHYVVFRDNTKWCAAVVSELATNWGGKKRPLFQNHAVSICQTVKGRFIKLNEAHYICAILNAPITAKYLLNSSDSRSFKIRPPIFIPEFDKKNIVHTQLAKLSKTAHKKYSNKVSVKQIDKRLDELIVKLKK